MHRLEFAARTAHVRLRARRAAAHRPVAGQAAARRLVLHAVRALGQRHAVAARLAGRRAIEVGALLGAGAIVDAAAAAAVQRFAGVNDQLACGTKGVAVAGRFLDEMTRVPVERESVPYAWSCEMAAPVASSNEAMVRLAIMVRCFAGRGVGVTNSRTDRADFECTNTANTSNASLNTNSRFCRNNTALFALLVAANLRSGVCFGSHAALWRV